ncbi:hypothetical protein J4212_02165 [Candidatus Woesearchaeota archaeon]|nr:hypothetical protein [Candidatus Woesearchaeota archaeon]
MNLKMRYANSAGYIKLENAVAIKEVMINEDFLHPDNESIAIGFRSRECSGLLEFTPDEFEKVSNSVKRKIHLIKGFKVIGSENAGKKG